MIKQTFKIIWKERKINLMILCELILSFLVLWLCVDYLTFITMRLKEPTGFNFENVYRVCISTSDEIYEDVYTADDTEAKIAELKEKLQTFYDRIDNYPGVELTSCSRYASPYAGHRRGRNFRRCDTISEYAFTRYVTPAYFELFDIELLNGRIWNDNDMLSENKVIISGNYDNEFAEINVKEVSNISMPIAYSDEVKQLEVIGVVERTKGVSDFRDYECVVYFPLSHNDEEIVFTFDFCVKVHAENERDFITKFKHDMQESLTDPPYFFLYINSINALHERNTLRQRDNDSIKSIYVVSLFLIVNIFLGLIGTFWFRMQSRRNDIGLRRALGSSKKDVKTLFISEAMLLLLLASVIATIIAINISYINILESIGLPAPSRPDYLPIYLRYGWNYLITFLLIGIITIISVWYPAKRAADVNPVEALRDEN